MMPGWGVGANGNGGMVGDALGIEVGGKGTVGEGVIGNGVSVMVIDGATVRVGGTVIVALGIRVGAEVGVNVGGTNRVGKSRWVGACWQAIVEASMIRDRRSSQIFFGFDRFIVIFRMMGN
jgi:hypothetical protein